MWKLMLQNYAYNERFIFMRNVKIAYKDQLYTLKQMISSEELCPVCQNKIQKTNISIESDSRERQHKFYALSCEKCHILYVDDRTINGLMVFHKTKDKPLPLSKICYHEFISNTEPRLNNLIYTTVDANISNKRKCWGCGNRLIMDSINIEHNNRNGYYCLHGLACEKCRILYTKYDVVDAIYEDCKRNFPKNLKHYYGKRKYLQFQKSAEVLMKNENVVCVIQTNDRVQYKIIKEYDGTLDETFFPYTSEFAREILADIYRSEKNKEYSYKEQRGKIRYYYACDSLKNNLIGSGDLCIKTGGGLKSSKRRGGDQFVDILFYSPFTNRYEIVTVTYNKFDDEYYLDIHKWRRFIQKYGNPNFVPTFESGRNSRLSYNLRERSILNDYGYKSTLSAQERRAILTEMVDLDIISVSGIIQHLEFFISVPGARDNMYYSRKVWEEDLKFIENYDVNPERFLVARSP